MVTVDWLKTRHQNIPGIETVTLTPGTGAAAIPSVTAERRPVRRQADGIASISTDEIVFILHSVSVGTTPPKVDDRITDANGITYRILTVNTELLQTRHRCQCVKNK